MKRLVITLVATAVLLVAAMPQPASGVVHEIVGQWCADRGELEPPGLTREGSKNFARPLVAAGIVQDTPVNGTEPGITAGPGILIEFDFTQPQVKVVPTGTILVLATGIPGVGALYIEEFELGNRPPFTRCARLRT